MKQTHGGVIESWTDQAVPCTQCCCQECWLTQGEEHGESCEQVVAPEGIAEDPDANPDPDLNPNLIEGHQISIK